MEHVTRPHDLERERADQDEPDQRVAVALAPRGEPVDAEHVGAGREPSTGRARPREAVREHEAGEGGGADGMREEGEAAKDDPRPEQARRYGQEERFERAPLHERVVEGAEHLNENGYRSQQLLA